MNRSRMKMASRREIRLPIGVRTASLICGFAIALVPYWQSAAATEPSDDPQVVRLIGRLKHDDFEERRRAADSLGDMGAAAASAVPDLVEALKDEHVEVHWYALDALGRIGQIAGAAVPALIAELTNPRTNRYSRRVTARALGRFGPMAAEAVTALAGYLDADDHELRVESALALWRVNADPRTIEVLSRLIDSGTDPAAFQACLALAQIGPAARQSIPTLLAALAGADADVRRAAARALGSIGTDSLEPIAAKLAERSSSLDPEARASAADALALIADDVRRSAFDRAGATAQQIAAAVAPFDGRVIPLLTQLLNSDEPLLSQHAARALAAIGLPALPALADALSSDQPSVRHAAQAALDVVEQASSESTTAQRHFQSRLRSAVPALNRALKGDRGAQQTAARALALLPIPGDTDTIDRLRQVIKTDDLATRHFAAQALTRFENQKQAH